jgi:hypothetical protein
MSPSINGNTCFRSTCSLITPVKYICTESKVLTLLIYNASFLLTHLGSPENEWIALCIPYGDPQFKSLPAQVPGCGCTSSRTFLSMSLCWLYSLQSHCLWPIHILHCKASFFCSKDQIQTVTSVSRSTQCNYKKPPHFSLQNCQLQRSD